MKILMVCLGNICRSPLAEGILKEKIRSHQLDWTVDSAGTGSWHIGENPDPRSIEIARRYDIDISGQQARQIKAHDLNRYDLIFAMDESNYRDILQLADSLEQQSRIEMIMNLVDPARRLSVPDPYWDDDGFEQVFQMLEKACDRVIEEYAGKEA